MHALIILYNAKVHDVFSAKGLDHKNILYNFSFNLLAMSAGETFSPNQNMGDMEPFWFPFLPLGKWFSFKVASPIPTICLCSEGLLMSVMVHDKYSLWKIIKLQLILSFCVRLLNTDPGQPEKQYKEIHFFFHILVDWIYEALYIWWNPITRKNQNNKISDESSIKALDR